MTGIELFNTEEVIFKYQVQMLYIDPDCEAIYMTGPGGQSSERHWSLRVSAKKVPKYPHRKVGGRLDKSNGTDISI